MAFIVIETTQEERDAVLAVIRDNEGVTMPVSKIAELCDLRDTRVRYALADLVANNIIQKIPTRAFNKHYVRYAYKVV